MAILSYILAGLSLLMSFLFLVRSPKPPLGFLVLIFKLSAGALSAFWAAIGLVGAVLGWVFHALWAVPMGILGDGMMIRYIWSCTRDHNGFENAFGNDWSDHAFDLLLPQVSPPTQSALYDVDRFLALLLNKEKE